MFEKLHRKSTIQLILGLIFGIGFGFLLQKGGVTSYDVIIGQLLLTDFTVLKLMLSAVIVGMIGLHIMKHLGWLDFHVFRGSIGSTVIGGCIFGIGFAILGFCPGTLAGAIGTGQMDALLGGGIGMLIGTGLFAHFYPVINKKFMDRGVFPVDTVPQLLRLPSWIVVLAMVILMSGFLIILEMFKL
ncbi:YeeE/YedE thiosulfate transporter family protein [Methanospirillum lacunae]|uniref:YeeE/YedE family protein n=1 Tax=Methanospirillum lacunae TaxID=668570 RepID=A0A2V2NCM0_9EURY|nr:YeeE/YedE thiosulfate transporter family protein [Methanospirillum lacunae]PWR73053.1 YeeE/YedE family protein [Methanospirillum lacunae]